MYKLRIIHKGLVLVGVPLLFGIAFILMLFYGLYESNRLFQHEMRLKDAMIADDAIAQGIFASRISAITFFITREKFYEEAYSVYVSEAASSYKVLQKLLKKEPVLQFPLKMVKTEIVTSNRGYTLIMHGPQLDVSISDVFQMFGGLGVGKFFNSLPVFSLMDKLQHMANRETAAALNAMNLLQITLVGGMLGSALITIVLVVFFCLNITNRLLIIMNNTVSLSKGTQLQPPLKGEDEIAELDQFLFKSAAEIRELERFKKEMIGVVSHELKSPLSSVAAFLSSLGGGVYGEISKKAQERVERSHKSVERLMNLVKELLVLDRLELELSPEEIPVNDILASSVDTINALSEKTGIEVVVDSGGGYVFADRNRLVQVIVNLVSNAMKFSPPDGKVTIKTRMNDGWFECRVSDQGRGIPEEFRKQIFEPFKQVDARDATTKKGTGLGLTISRSIVEQHGGKIDVDSELDVGSTFWFKIPATQFGRSASASGTQTAAIPESFQQENSLKTGLPVLRTESGGSVSASVSSGRPSRQGAVSPRRFSVLQQGLIIIAVPLIFQLGFACLIGGQLVELRRHIDREKHSKEIIECISKMEEKYLMAANDGILYVYSRDPLYLESWQSGKKDAYERFHHVKELTAGNPKQKAESERIGEWLDKVNALVEMMVGLNRENELGSVSKLQAYMKKNNLEPQIRPLLQGQELQKRLLARENAIGDKLAAQRLEKIGTIHRALSAGIFLNIVLSLCLAFFLMRSMTDRLQHVMKNTARLVKRETMDPPRAGSDEIAFLDKLLFETGKRLVELEEFKRQLISVVSHELRTPLLAISSVLELLSGGVLGELSTKAQSRLNFAQEETDRLIRLINDLLDIEKMEAGKFVLDKSEVKAAYLVSQAISSVAQLAEMKEVKLIQSAADATLYADGDRLCQVLINLLSNAIKFSPHGGEINIVVESKGPQMEFRVIDQGRGIPEELQKTVFDRFVQVEKTDATEKGGSGLGLAIARAIVEQHAGKIGVESQLDKGSTFWFTIPVEKPAPISAPSPAEISEVC